MRLFRPARKEEVKLIADFDAMIAEPVKFQLLGKIHTIKPISTQVYLQFSQTLARVYEMHRKEEKTPEEIINLYVDLIQMVCSTVSREDITERMENGQLAGLINLIVETVTGRAQASTPEEVKKKVLSQVNSNQ